MTREAAFRGALLDPRAPVPAGLVDGAGRPAGRRYAVYRNNVAVSLRDALAAGFPAVAARLGPALFSDVALDYLRASPPDTPVLQHWGTGFPDYLAAHPHLADRPDLPDLARLDLLIRQSYHAADHEAADPAPLATMDEATLMTVRLRLAPSLRLLSSPWPVLSLRRVVLDGGPEPSMAPEEIVVLRPDFDPEPRALPAGGVAILSALRAGAPLGAAWQTAPDTDLGQVLAPLLETRAIVAIDA
ncbi:hypothetical protein ROJ8625_02540 [Roseivivax jejudonensis]|uniref:Putative DNA-binding domain-containing protein n=1 Tax=Roseivivax jejudonensis TaxID=1529041 RepID=A0A1X6ZH26_9RHOB|nr:DNA-binding domain-containing protein [Roseivivax jejudonensis]SLN51030.1 hypothetical protein ROJ8625_02540 [Roseivivax jejudonensis]